MSAARTDDTPSVTRAAGFDDRARACLVGGAIGDALGAPVEFWSLAEIRERLGREGLQDYATAEGIITDDTQMTLFTAEGLLRAHNRRVTGGASDLRGALYRAYLRWDYTQRTVWPSTARDTADTSGWLLRHEFLHHPRAPGRTCLSALRADRMGTVDAPLNHSKGCGGVMRVAPIAVVADQPFDVAVASAALTHGHPTGYLASGAGARLIASLLGGAELRESVAGVLQELQAHPESAETRAALQAALDLSASADVKPETLERLGGGWVAEEALAIAVFCALVAEDYRSGVLLAVNHSGDSDSTGAIAGNLLGARHGMAAIPAAWVEQLEGRAVIEQMARDLLRARRHPDEPVDLDRYPPD